MNILICGFGNIGKHIYKEFYALKDCITIYDKYINEFSNLEKLKKKYDYAFISVPTEMGKDGACDISEVRWIIDKIMADTIIIKSAIPVGTCQMIGKENLVISPEYYGTTQHSLEYPDFLILGGNKSFSCKVQQLYSKIKNGSFRYIFVDWKTAELSKYMENCWIATKVTFCNEFAEIADKYDVNYAELRECFIADERVSPSHTYVYKDKPYYDSHCLNKDIPALIHMCEDNNIAIPLMQSVHRIKETRSKGIT